MVMHDRGIFLILSMFQQRTHFGFCKALSVKRLANEIFQQIHMTQVHGKQGIHLMVVYQARLSLTGSCVGSREKREKV